MNYKNIIQSIDRSFRYASLKTKHIGHYSGVVSRINSNLIKIARNEDIALEDKITFHELKTLKVIVNLHKTLYLLSQQTVLTGDLKKLFKISTQARRIFDDINNNLGIEASDILMYDFNRQSFFRKESHDIEETLTKLFVSKYSHAAQVYEDKHGKKRLTHVWWKKYQTDDVTISEISYSDIYRIDPVKLIAESVQEIWKKQNPKKDFVSCIRKQFQVIHNDLHENSQKEFKKISNDMLKRFKSGLADLGLFGGHKSWFKQTRNSLHDGVDTKMICSEFIAHSILSAIIALNKILQEELGIKTQAVNLPFCDKERIDRIHPQRLIKVCLSHGFIKKVQPSLKAQMFVSSNLKYHKKRYGLRQRFSELFTSIA